MKKFLLVMGGIFTAIVVIFAVLFSVIMFTFSDVRKEGKIYIEEEMPKILNHWNKEEFYNHSCQELKNELEAVDFDAYWNFVSRLGSLKEIKSIDYQGSRRSLGSTEGNLTTTTYKINSDFEMGECEIIVVIKKENEAWLIKNFKVNSTAFLKL